MSHKLSLKRVQNLIWRDQDFQWSIAASLLYGFCSGSMNFLNKAVLSIWEFHHASMIILCQIITLSCGLYILKKFGKLNLVDYTFKRARSLWKLSLIYCINSVIALSALSDMNIPMYNAMRRCVPIGSLILGCCVFKKEKPNFVIAVAVGIITIGTFVAAAGDLDFRIKGYLYGMLSVVVQSLYLVSLQKAEQDLKIGALGITYINSISCSPILFLMVLLSGDIPSIFGYGHWSNVKFLTCYWVLVLYGCIFTYSMFLCTTVNSALTTALMGVLKSAITTFAGMYTFGGVSATTMLVLGQIINLSGGILYTWEKYRLASCKQLNIPFLSGDLKSESDLVRLNEVKTLCFEDGNSTNCKKDTL